MTNYYEIFNLNPKWSNWRLLRSMEKIIRIGLQHHDDVSEALNAFRIFLSEESRKIYDSNLKSGDNTLRSRRFIEAYIQKTPQFLEDQNFALIFSEKNFLNIYSQQIFNQMFGLDFLFQGLGKRSSAGEVEEVSTKTTQAAFRFYFYFYYGIPILLGYFVNPWFYLLFIPIVLIKWHKEYKRVKTEYYFLKLE